jgi:hypothetical protein
MKQFAPFLVMIAVLITISVLVATLANYNLKRRIIDKGPIDEHALAFLNKLTGLDSEMLKWGLILLFGGLGLLVLEFVPQSSENSPLPYGIEAIFIAAGLLCYYFILKRKKQK